MTTETKNPYRVWHNPQVPGPAFFYEVPDLKTAKILTEALGLYDLFQFDNQIKPDYASAGGIEVWEDGEWLPVDEEDL